MQTLKKPAVVVLDMKEYLTCGSVSALVFGSGLLTFPFL